MKLSTDQRTDWREDLLREVARDILGAARCRDTYLDALRVVLGNLARADARGAVVELNSRVEFASEKTMRTLLDQLREAGITTQVRKGLGAGRVQVVSMYAGRSERCLSLDLEDIDRMLEARADQRREASVHTPEGQKKAQEFNDRMDSLGIEAADVPY